MGGQQRPCLDLGDGMMRMKVCRKAASLGSEAGKKPEKVGRTLNTKQNVLHMILERIRSHRGIWGREE